MSRKPKSPLARAPKDYMSGLRAAIEEQRPWRRDYLAGRATWPAPPHAYLFDYSLVRLLRLEESTWRWLERNRTVALDARVRLNCMRRHEPWAYEAHMLRKEVAALESRVSSLEDAVSDV